MIEQLIAEATECDFKVALETKKPKRLVKKCQCLFLMGSAALCFSESLMTGSLSACQMFKRMLKRSAA